MRCYEDTLLSNLCIYIIEQQRIVFVCLPLLVPAPNRSAAGGGSVALLPAPALGANVPEQKIVFFAHLLRTGVSTLWGPLPAISCHKMT